MPTRREASAAYLASGGRIYVDSRRGWWPPTAAFVLVVLVGVAAVLTVLWAVRW